MKFDWSAWMNKGNKIAIHCETKEEAIELFELFSLAGCEWADRTEYYTNDTRWGYYGSSTCYTNRGEYGREGYYEDYDYTIWEMSELEDCRTELTNYLKKKEEIINVIKEKVNMEKVFEWTPEQRKNLIDEMSEVLRDYYWKHTEYALGVIVDKWYESKKKLLDILCNHPQWNPDKFYVHFDSDYTREFDTDEIYKFKMFICKAFSKLDENQQKSILKKIKNTIKSERILCNVTYYSRLSAQMETFVNEFFRIVTDNGSSTISKECVEVFADVYDMKPKAGQKVSRYINKVCADIGITNFSHPMNVTCEDGNVKEVEYTYNQAYAKLADALNPIKYTRHTVISVNPIDYLLMSNGNSWASCHTIDMNNSNPNNYDGCYCGGTVSYMLDEVSFVYYTVDRNYNENIEREEKLTRQMFHYDNFKLAQARLYPQSNDSNIANNLKKDIREIVQKVFADCLGIPNLWKTEKHDDGVTSDLITRKRGSAHYADYANFTVYLSHPSTLTDDEIKTIYYDPITTGARRICIESGEEYEDDTDTINYTSGRPSGEKEWSVYEDRYIYEDLEDYEWVSSVNSYVSVRTIENEFIRCAHCNSWIPDSPDYVEYDEDGEAYCKSCIRRFFKVCSDCGAYTKEFKAYLDENGVIKFYCRDCLENRISEQGACNNNE